MRFKKYDLTTETSEQWFIHPKSASVKVVASQLRCFGVGFFQSYGKAEEFGFSWQTQIISLSLSTVVIKSYIIIFNTINYKIEVILVELKLNNLASQLRARFLAIHCSPNVYIYILFNFFFFLSCLLSFFSTSLFLSSMAPISLSTKPSLSSLRGVTYVH